VVGLGREWIRLVELGGRSKKRLLSELVLDVVGGADEAGLEGGPVEVVVGGVLLGLLVDRAEAGVGAETGAVLGPLVNCWVQWRKEGSVGLVAELLVGRFARAVLSWQLAVAVVEA